MDMNYDILSYDELPADEAAMLKADAEDAERGYTDEQLSEALKRTPGRPLAVGSTPASNVIRVRLDDERDAKLERYMRKHHMSRSNAVRTLLDKALAEICCSTRGQAVRPAAESLPFFNLRYTADVRVSRRPAHEAAAARRWARRRVEPVEHVAGPGPTRGREPHSQSGSMPIRSRAVCGTGLSRALRNSSNALDGRRVTVSSSIPR